MGSGLSDRPKSSVASTDLRRLLASKHINNAYGPDEQVGEAFKDVCHKGYGEGGDGVLVTFCSIRR